MSPYLASNPGISHPGTVDSKQRCLLPSSSKITRLVPDTDRFIQVSMGRTSLNLLAEKFKKSSLFGVSIDTVAELLQFWKTCDDFIKSNDDTDDKEEPEQHLDQLKLFKTPDDQTMQKNIVSREKETSIDLFDDESVNKDAHTDNNKDAHTDNNKDAHTDNKKDEHTDNNKDAHTDNNKDAHTDNNKDEHTDNNKDEHTDNNKDEHTDNNKDAHTNNNKDAHTDNNKDEHTDNNKDEHTDNNKDEHTDNNKDEHTDNNKDEHTDNPALDRDSLVNSILKKFAAFKILDIFMLHPPPLNYMVRDVDDAFVTRLTEKMVKKKYISVENAPTIIGLVDVNRADFKQDELPSYTLHIINGNHSIKAQKAAYRKTGDEMYKYRVVNIYCGLTENEALFLGVSRSEDTGAFVPFTDFQKVKLIRRKLYFMTHTPEEEDPPNVPKEFTEIFACLLNLKGKKAIDGKNIIRFLATSLSSECFKLFKEICQRGGLVPASKFCCLRGLENIDVYNCLLELSTTKLEKSDWQIFASSCFEKQKKSRKRRKDVSAIVEFGNHGTHIFINNKQMPGSCYCFKFCTNVDEITLTSGELEDLVFSTGSAVEKRYKPKSKKQVKQDVYKKKERGGKGTLKWASTLDKSFLAISEGSDDNHELSVFCSESDDDQGNLMSQSEDSESANMENILVKRISSIPACHNETNVPNKVVSHKPAVDTNTNQGQLVESVIVEKALYTEGVPIGPLSEVIPRRYQKYLSKGLLKSYLSDNQKDADVFRKLCDPADIPVIVKKKSTQVYPHILKYLTEEGEDIVKEVNPWLVNTLIDWANWDDILCSNPVKGKTDASIGRISVKRKRNIYSFSSNDSPEKVHVSESYGEQLQRKHDLVLCDGSSKGKALIGNKGDKCFKNIKSTTVQKNIKESSIHESPDDSQNSEVIASEAKVSIQEKDETCFTGFKDHSKPELKKCYVRLTDIASEKDVLAMMRKDAKRKK